MKVKAGQYWKDVRDLDKLDEKSFHGAKILNVRSRTITLQFYHYHTGKPYNMISEWNIESLYESFLLDESHSVLEILSHYD